MNAEGILTSNVNAILCYHIQSLDLDSVFASDSTPVWTWSWVGLEFLWLRTPDQLLNTNPLHRHQKKDLRPCWMIPKYFTLFMLFMWRCLKFSDSLLPPQTVGATDWEMFQIDGRFFLAVANSQKVSDRDASPYSINSTVYELSMLTQTFIRFQDILTHR